ncbi:MAG: flagellin [Phycisphaerales bacterium]|nr:flagellin [Phycisphaerales bacterium]
MSRINTNVPSLIAQRVLGRNASSLGVSLERLSTGLRINRGKDDPAGLIASENLRAEKTALGAAIKNAERADQVVNIAEGGLNEVSSLLTEVQSLITQAANAAGLSKEEREANQLQIDSILQTVDRIASATSFQGLKLLNGNFDYVTQNASAVVQAFRVNGAKLNRGQTLDVSVVVTASAQVGGFLLSFAGTRLNLGGPGPSDGAGRSFIVEVAGSRGSRELSFSSGTTLADIRAAINSFRAVTGVQATVSGTAVRLASDDYGSDQFVSLRVIDDGGIGSAGGIGIYSFQAQNAAAANAASAQAFSAAAQRTTAFGRDVQATINGARATTRGTVARVSSDFLDVEVNLAWTTAGTAPNAARLGSITAFRIAGGGADFQLASRVDINGKVALGIPNVAAREMGRRLLDFSGSGVAYFLSDLATGRPLNLVDGNVDGAQSVVEAAIRDISALRGRLGAFQKNTIGATIRSLGISQENTTAAESVIRDADFAAETAALTRNQILVSASTQVLGIANNQPQSALQLLG